MVNDIFIDGAESVTVQGTVVRVNLTVSSATEKDDNGDHLKEVRHRVIMTSQAAIELHRALDAALRRLTEAGVVTRREAGQPAESEDA